MFGQVHLVLDHMVWTCELVHQVLVIVVLKVIQVSILVQIANEWVILFRFIIGSDILRNGSCFAQIRNGFFYQISSNNKRLCHCAKRFTEFLLKTAHVGQ